MREIRATKLSAGDVADVIGGEIITLYAGKLGFRAILLPASKFWQQKIYAEYAATGRAICTTREALTSAHIAEIVIRQVDGKWNPYTYGKLVHAEKVRAFIVPFNYHWERLVAERRRDDRLESEGGEQ